ncbi:hypothetical protein H0H92_008681 [Tricholoma furcatifolium]|nr:hypothetical protein H0H92_008681 [Tricholoma furcatifolium]
MMRTNNLWDLKVVQSKVYPAAGRNLKISRVKRVGEVARRALLAASVAATGAILQPHEKLSIYPASTPDVILIETPSALEHEIELKSIISPHESLAPGLLYVSVATRNRGFATRFILPLIFLYASAKHFLPQTTENLSSYLGSLEETHFPTLAKKNTTLRLHTQK